MREVYLHPFNARKKGLLARNDIQRRYSLTKIGLKLESEFKRIKELLINYNQDTANVRNLNSDDL